MPLRRRMFPTVSFGPRCTRKRNSTPSGLRQRGLCKTRSPESWIRSRYVDVIRAITRLIAGTGAGTSEALALGNGLALTADLQGANNRARVALEAINLTVDQLVVDRLSAGVEFGEPHQRP